MPCSGMMGGGPAPGRRFTGIEKREGGSLPLIETLESEGARTEPARGLLDCCCC